MADAASLWFGLFVVEVALRKIRDDARRPALRAMVDDLGRLRRPIVHVLSLLLWQTATPADLPHMKAAAAGSGDVSEVLARLHLTASPAAMLELGILTGPHLTWWQVITRTLSPSALRLDVLIARYVSIADAEMLAALQALENCIFMDFVTGRLVFDDDKCLVIFWRSLIQSLAILDERLTIALREHEGRDAVLGPNSYIDFAIGQIEKGSFPPVGWLHPR